MGKKKQEETLMHSSSLSGPPSWRLSGTYSTCLGTVASVEETKGRGDQDPAMWVERG